MRERGLEPRRVRAMNHLTEEQLVLYHYGDADRGEAGSIEEHLHACASCQADLDGIRRTLAGGGRARRCRPRTDGYGAEVWARIQPSLDAAGRLVVGAGRSRSSSPRRLVLAGGVAVLVVAAFVAGRFLPRPTATPALDNGAGWRHGAWSPVSGERRRRVRRRGGSRAAAGRSATANSFANGSSWWPSATTSSARRSRWSNWSTAPRVPRWTSRASRNARATWSPRTASTGRRR